MKNPIKSGWHEYKGAYLYIEDGRVIRGQRDGRTTYPYKRVKDGWDYAAGIKYEYFKKLWNADKIAMK